MMKLLRNRLFQTGCWIFLLLSLLAIQLKAAARTGENYTASELRNISRVTRMVLSRNHYRKLPQDTQLSEKLFDAYFKTLDPGKLYFTQADLRKYAGRRTTLIRELEKGNVGFAFEIYALYARRRQAFRDFTVERFKKPFDFSADETFEADRKNAPYPADEAAMRALWEKKLKNDLLFFRLSDRSLKEGKKNADKKDAKTRDKEKIQKLWEGRTPEERVLQRLRDYDNSLIKREPIEILGVYLNTLALLYGPHSAYMSPSLDEDFDIHMRLSLSGIGATLTSDDGYIKVVDLVPGGPAAKDGRLQVEDRIIAVTQEDSKTTDLLDMPVGRAVKFIRGPKGSAVTLTVLPGKGGRSALPVQIRLIRDEVKLVDSEAKGEIREIPQKDGTVKRVGIISLPGFYRDYEAERRGDGDFKSCARDIQRILKDFRLKKVDAVVLDMRKNGGGYFEEALQLTGLFIKSGPIVQVANNKNEVEVMTDDDDKAAYNGPLVVLLSKLSASSTEIFSGAIRDLKRGVIVGDSRSFGKGTVLSVCPVNRLPGLFRRKLDGGSVTFETAMFFRPGGSSVQLKGIASDVVIPSLTEEMEVGEEFLDNPLPFRAIEPRPFQPADPKLDAKIAQLKRLSAKRVGADPRFARIRRSMEVYRKFKKKKLYSLCEAKRWADYQEEKKFMEESDAMLGEDTRSKEKKADAVLDEAVSIAVDLAGME